MATFTQNWERSTTSQNYMTWIYQSHWTCPQLAYGMKICVPNRRQYFQYVPLKYCRKSLKIVLRQSMWVKVLSYIPALLWSQECGNPRYLWPFSSFWCSCLISSGPDGEEFQSPQWISRCIHMSVPAASGVNGKGSLGNMAIKWKSEWMSERVLERKCLVLGGLCWITGLVGHIWSPERDTFPHQRLHVIKYFRHPGRQTVAMPLSLFLNKHAALLERHFSEREIPLTVWNVERVHHKSTANQTAQRRYKILKYLSKILSSVEKH